MKRIYVALIFTVILSSLNGQSIRLNMNYLSHNLTEDSAYIEFQFSFIGNTLVYAPTATNQYIACVKVNFDFSDKAEKSKKINRDMNFNSALYPDSLSENKKDFYTLYRIALPKGHYLFTITIEDVNNPSSKPLQFSQSVNLIYREHQINFSDIQLLALAEKSEQTNYYSKHGWNYIPYFSNYYPLSINSLSYWLEIYNTDQLLGSNQEVKVNTYISTVSDGTTKLDGFNKTKKYTAAATVFHFQTYDISNLPTGNYYLNIEVKNDQDTILGYTHLFFQRRNDQVEVAEVGTEMPFDTLKLYFDYIYPIATETERTFIRNFVPEHLDAGEHFFFDFWSARNPKDPQAAWYDYYIQVMQVNNNYSTLRYKGYRTDRGICYLKYGKPTEIETYNFSGEKYPYEIWRYNIVPNGQINTFFVFYNRDKTTKDFELLHSSVYGEPKFPNWEEEVGRGRASINLPDENAVYGDK